MKIKFLFLIGFLSISSHFYAQSVDNRTVFFVGHSLVNLDMPEMFDGIANSLNKTNAYDLQMGIGASLWWNYNNPHSAQGSDPFVELPTGNYNTFVMTEALPLVSQLSWGDTTYTYATNFHNLGAAANPNMQTYIYETWHCVNSGTPEGCDGDPNEHILWRDRLDQDLPLWEGIADAVDNRSPYGAPSVLLVPAGQGLGAVYDNIAMGTLPGLTDVSELFADNIHMNDLGNYFVALVQYATIYKESPVGAAANLTNIWGNPFDIPYENTALINRLQEIAWEVVSNYPRSGVNIVLPIEMISFEAKSKDCTIDLNWKINTSINHDYFEVERSLDGRYFERMATLGIDDFYKNKDRYHFVDKTVFEGQYYYRLKQVELDGTYDYSETKTVKTACLDVLSFHVFPNPTNDMLNISTEKSLSQNAKILISNSLGQIVKTVPLHHQLDVSNMVSGLYFIQIVSHGQQSQTQRLVINH